MYLSAIQVLNFKNYDECSLSFSPALNIFAGPNGSGKTNLLDAIYFLCLTKSAFHSNDSLLIRHKEDFLVVTGQFIKNSKTVSVQAGLKKGQKKVFQRDRKPYPKISEHIGMFPVVIITPYDTDLIREGSEERRKFFDSILSQTDTEYLSDLLAYNKVLKQRNALLKLFAENGQQDLDLLSGYDYQLIHYGKKLYAKRKNLMDAFAPVFQQHYTNISDNQEQVTLSYESELEKEDFESEFVRNRKKDLLLQRTTKGSHKDDFLFSIEGHPLKTTGSQGQQKSFVIALKLAQFEYIQHCLRQKPILLLDDIFDKLDQNRIQKLLTMISEEVFGQVFITEAGQDRVEKYLHTIGGEIRTFTIKEGNVTSPL